MSRGVIYLISGTDAVRTLRLRLLLGFRELETGGLLLILTGWEGVREGGGGLTARDWGGRGNRGGGGGPL